MNAYQTTPPRNPGGDYLFEAGFDADFNDKPVAEIDSAAIKQRAHVMNGGEGTEMFTCPACRGRGRFISYAGRDVGPCFKCKGTAKISKGQNAAIKGKATKEANRAKWAEDHAAEIAYVQKRAGKGSNFYASFAEKMAEYGSLTENQMAVVHKDMAADVEFFAKKKAEREAAAPVIQMSAIEALFATATDNDVKRPIFRFEGGEISKAPASGRNAGALYVKDGDQYCGKIVGGKFHATFAAPKDMADRLMAVAANPTKAAMAYGRRFGRCGICGKGLVDPVSIRAGLGPICSDKFGLDFRREMAREELNEEAAAEAAKEGK